MSQTLRRYRKALANGLLVQKLLQLLKGAGIVIEPYYFYQEQADRALVVAGRERLGDFEFFEASAADVDGLAALNPRRDPREEILAEFAAGRRCFTLRRGKEIVAASWCDEREILFEPCRRALGPNEAYLYRMETHPGLRGHDLAPFLRLRCLEVLAAEGRDRILSYTDYFNRPATRFKEKIGAQILFVGLHVKLFGLPSFNRVLSRREEGASPLHAASGPPGRGGGRIADTAGS